jgi:hypothetical protein
LRLSSQTCASSAKVETIITRTGNGATPVAAAGATPATPISEATRRPCRLAARTRFPHRRLPAGTQPYAGEATLSLRRRP